MKGLQSSQIDRSQYVNGTGILELNDLSEKFAFEVSDFLKNQNIDHHREYIIEVLLKYEQSISPAIIHGVDNRTKLPSFLKSRVIEEMILPFELGARIHSELGSKIQLISPSHVDEFFGDIPRSISVYVEDYISTRVPEVDNLHGWVPLKKIQNLIGQKSINRIVIYGYSEFAQLKQSLKEKFGANVHLQTWDEQNETLVWSLQLESIVMLFLFISMTLLVSLCITLGLLIFFNKIKADLASFWIMGASKNNLEKSSWALLNILSITAVSVGIICSLIFLILFQEFGGEIMPDNFVDRKIPILITGRGILISFLVPYLISVVISYMSLVQFKRDTNYLDQVRSI